jgi:Bacterial conjugation TrbI-like protein
LVHRDGQEAIMRFFSVSLLLSALAIAQAAPPTTDLQSNSSDAPIRVTVPAGTKIPLVLKHAISTKSVRPGDPVYLQTNFPVAQDNRILIPSGTYVQGVVDSVKRAGRVSGRAELLMHFTTMIFPNGYTVTLPGSVEGVPGEEHSAVKDKEGTIQADSEKGKDAATVAKTTGTGAAVGALAAGGKGAGIGAGAGGVLGLATVLLSRGQDVRMEAGSTVEMELQRPLTLEEARVTTTNRDLIPVSHGRRLEHPMNPPPGTR